MNKRTSYEQQLAEELKKLPLPDEDKAWAAMQHMLNEKDDRRPPFAIPIMLQGCRGWIAIMVLVLLAGGAAYYFLDRKNEKEQVASTIPVKETRSGIPLQGNDNKTQPESTVDVASTGNKSVNNEVQPGVNGSRPNLSRSIEDGETPLPVKKKKRPSRTQSRRNINIKPAITNAEVATQEDNDQDFAVVTQEQEEKIFREEPGRKQDSSETNTDSAEIVKIEETPADSMAGSEPGKKKVKQRFSVAAGIAFQHALSLNGSRASTGLLEKRTDWGDYVPSVYVRLHRGKWFMQSEFKYGSPQYGKGFTYRTINQDTVQGVSFATSYYLRKSYYHQVPLSLHYTIKPGWSVGAGIVYNRFNGTISERSLKLSVAGTPVDTILEKRLVDAKYDSAFSRNTWQWMAESQYRWKRFSIGARYASGLQPFIRYRDADGSSRSRKLHSLNIFLRFELWKPKQ